MLDDLVIILSATPLKDILHDEPHWYLYVLLQVQYDLDALWLSRDSRHVLDADIMYVPEQKRLIQHLHNIFIVSV